MSEQEYRKLTREDLDQITGGELPERAAMSLVNANVFLPVNAAVAANVLSDKSMMRCPSTSPIPGSDSS